MKLSRRKLILGTVASAGILPFRTQAASGDSSATQKVFTNTTIVTNDLERRTLVDHAMAIENDLIVAIGRTEDILLNYPSAQIYDGNRSTPPRLDQLSLTSGCYRRKRF